MSDSNHQATSAPHPMQPVIRYPDGVMRFRSNAIIDWLRNTGRLNLSEVSLMCFPDADRMQLAQLLGYSVVEYGELPYASEESVALADAAAGGHPGTENDQADVIGDQWRAQQARVSEMESVLRSLYVALGGATLLGDEEFIRQLGPVVRHYRARVAEQLERTPREGE